MMPYQAPELNKEAFNCSICHAYSVQKWMGLTVGFGNQYQKDWRVCNCQHCGSYSFWHKQSMIFPDLGGVQPPNSDLDEEIQDDYQEAATIINKSPRGASAILRLALQKLCKQLGERGDNINEDIKALVKRGMPIQIQQALDIVRVVGNNAVHPGQLDIRDDIATATQLFALLNFIADAMITQPKRIQAFYDTLPLSTLDAINRRDQ